MSPFNQKTSIDFPPFSPDQATPHWWPTAGRILHLQWDNQKKKPLTSPGHGESDIYRKSKHHFFLAGFYRQKM